MSVLEELLAIGLDEASASTLVHWAADGVRGNLVILEGADVVAAPDIARALAASTFTDPNLIPHDLSLAWPDGDRWTMAEIDERILAPTHLRAYERTHVVVSAADEMSGAAHDHLLKSVEEPQSGAAFWFCVASAERLPATLRGRAAASFLLRPATGEQATSRLLEAGIAPEDAGDLARWCGGDLLLARAVHEAGALEACRAWAETPWATPTPTRTGDDLLWAMATLAIARERFLQARAVESDAVEASVTGRKATRRKAASKPLAPPTARGSLARVDLKKLAPPERAHLRRLVRVTLRRWASELTSEAALADSRAALSALERRLRAADRALAELGTNASPQTVLCGFLSRTNALPG